LLKVSLAIDAPRHRIPLLVEAAGWVVAEAGDDRLNLEVRIESEFFVVSTLTMRRSTRGLLVRALTARLRKRNRRTSLSALCRLGLPNPDAPPSAGTTPKTKVSVSGMVNALGVGDTLRRQYED
jgi:hypothetical protein